MADYDRRANKFSLRGVNITLPPDRLPLEWAEIMKNIRVYRGGETRQRPGLTLLGDLDAGSSAAVLWAMRASDPLTLPAFRRLFGTEAGIIYIDDGTHASFSSIDTGYDALGYSSIIARPDRSPSPFYFVANGARQSKFTALGARTNWGLPAPLTPMTCELVRIAYRLVNDCQVAGDFTSTGTGGLTNPARISAVAISHILYDSGSTGWASVAPAAMDENWQENVFVTTSLNAETVMIESIYPAISSTVISAIVYDNTGTNTGLCTIQLSIPTEGLQRNSMLRLGSTENVRVLSVTLGLDGIPSFRCSTVGTFSSGASVDGLRSFRAFFDNNHAVAETLSTNYISIPITGATTATVTRTAAIDGSSAVVGGTRPIQSEDFVHISLLVSDFASISEIQLGFDFDSGTNDFSQNFFFTSIRQPDLTNVISRQVVALTAQQQELQRQELDRYRRDQIATQQNQRDQQIQSLLNEKSALVVELVRDTKSEARKKDILRRLDEIDVLIKGQPFVIDQGLGPVSTVGASGTQQWSEIKIPVSKFQRVGSDMTRSWKDIAAFRLTIVTTATVTIGMDAVWIGGTYGPDSIGSGVGYNYVYVARNTKTGSMSNPSPPSRSPILAEREGIVGTIPAGYSDPQADVFDIYRIGGTLGTYQYVLTVPASAPTFTDSLPDDTVVQQRITEFDRFQPWPRPDRPKSGQGTAVGTRFTRTSGDSLDVNWARGTQIIIDNKTYTFYSQPETTETVQLNESAGAGTNLAWEIPEPLLVGQPMPVVFGPYKGGGSGEFHFGVGDPINPGYFYFTNGNDPESASDANILELCSPEEKLMNGGILDGIVYVFSDRRSWRILPSFNQGASGAGSLFYDQETAMGKGLAGKWAIAFGDRIYWVSYDGIYASRGDAVESITDESIAPLFRRDGSGYNQTLGGLVPISMTEADERYHHLTYSRDGIYHDYRGTDGNFYTNFYSFLTQGWVTDIYNDPITFTLREEDPYTDTIVRGSSTGKAYQLNALETSDAGAGIPCELRTREENWDDSRTNKQISDQLIDIDPAGQVVTPTIRFDGNTSNEVLTTITGALRGQFVRDVNAGLGTFANRAALSLAWTGLTGITKLYEWQPAALPKPELVLQRVTDWDTGDYAGPKWLQGMRLNADTLNAVKSIQIQYDESLVAATIDITHNGEVTKEYSWTPVVAHQMRIYGLDTDSWRILDVEWVFEPEPGLASRWHIQFTNLDLPGFHHIREVLIPHRSTAPITMEWIIDGVSTLYPNIIPSSAGARLKTYLPLVARKGKLDQAIFTSASPFSLYREDLEVRAGAWGRTEGYVTKRPFGDFSRATGEGGGARI